MSSVSIQHPNVKEHQLMKRRKALWDMLSSVTLLSNSFFKETFPYSAMNWRHIKAQQEIRNICFPILEFVTSKFYTYVYSYTSNTSWWSQSSFTGFELRPRHGYFRHVSRCYVPIVSNDARLDTPSYVRLTQQ